MDGATTSWMSWGEVLIGSDSSCQLCVDLPSISPIHARVWTELGQATARDTSAPRGLYVNSARVETEAVVGEGDVLWLGPPNEPESVCIQCRFEPWSEVLPMAAEQPVAASPTSSQPDEQDPFFIALEVPAPAPTAAVMSPSPVEEANVLPGVPDDAWTIGEAPPELASPAVVPVLSSQPAAGSAEGDESLVVDAVEVVPDQEALPAIAPLPAAPPAPTAAPPAAPPSPARPPLPAPPQSSAACSAWRLRGAPPAVAGSHAPTASAAQSPRSTTGRWRSRVRAARQPGGSVARLRLGPSPRSRGRDCGAGKGRRRRAPHRAVGGEGARPASTARISLVAASGPPGRVRAASPGRPTRRVASVREARGRRPHLAESGGARGRRGCPSGRARRVAHPGRRASRRARAGARACGAAVRQSRDAVSPPIPKRTPSCSRTSARRSSRPRRCGWRSRSRKSSPKPAASGRSACGCSAGVAPRRAITVSVLQGPRLHALSPQAAMPGEEVILAGAGLGLGASVRFGDVPAQIAQAEATRIRVAVPDLAGGTSAPVVVSVGGVDSNAVPFVVGHLPVVTGITPASARPGDVVRISGLGFVKDPLQDDVQIGGGAALVVSASDSTLEVVVPRVGPGEPARAVAVRVAGGANVGTATLDVPPPADPIEPRFVAEPFAAVPGRPHAVVATGLGPAFVLAASGGRTAAQRALEAQGRLNQAVAALQDDARAHPRGARLRREPRDRRCPAARTSCSRSPPRTRRPTARTGPACAAGAVP